MINVSFGHEFGIGFEVFIKSFILLSSEEQKLFRLFTNIDHLKSYLKVLNSTYSINENNLIIGQSSLQCHFLKSNPSLFHSSSSLIGALENTQSKDILITLPTSKDQLILNNNVKRGHTDFFRDYFKLDEITMCFYAPNCFMALLTDHLPLVDVSKTINEKLILDKFELVLSNFKKLFKTPKNIVIAGINPHSGENGLLGNEDQKIIEAIKILKNKYSQLNFIGPVSGDTLSRYADEKTIIMSMFHDQGLSFFKSLYKTIGINISLGMPFVRLSVDHGTAFDLFGKNQAQYIGCFYQLKQAIQFHQSGKL